MIKPIKPSTKTHIVFAIMIIGCLWTFGACFDNEAHAQADATPTPTATNNCWVQDGQLVCIGEGPVAVTATPTATAIAPTPEPTATPQINRPISVCAHPLWTCISLPIIHGAGEVTGDVR